MTPLELLREKLGEHAALLEHLPLDDLNILPVTFSDHIQYVPIRIRIGRWTEKTKKIWAVWVFMKKTTEAQKAAQGLPEIHLYGYHGTERKPLPADLLQKGCKEVPELEALAPKALPIVIKACFVLREVPLPSNISFSSDFLKSLISACTILKHTSSSSKAQTACPKLNWPRIPSTTSKERTLELEQEEPTALHSGLHQGPSVISIYKALPQVQRDASVPADATFKASTAVGASQKHTVTQLVEATPLTQASFQSPSDLQLLFSLNAHSSDTILDPPAAPPIKDHADKDRSTQQTPGIDAAEQKPWKEPTAIDKHHISAVVPYDTPKSLMEEVPVALMVRREPHDAQVYMKICEQDENLDEELHSITSRYHAMKASHDQTRQEMRMYIDTEIREDFRLKKKAARERHMEKYRAEEKILDEECNLKIRTKKTEYATLKEEQAKQLHVLGELRKSKTQQKEKIAKKKEKVENDLSKEQLLNFVASMSSKKRKREGSEPL